MKENNVVFGSAICLMSYLSVACMAACVKLVPHEINVGTIAFFQYVIALFLCLPGLCYAGVKSLKTERFAAHLIRDIAGITTFGLFFLSLNSLSLTNAVVLRSTTPFWIPLILFVWQGHRISKELWAAIVVGFIGVVFIIKPTSTGYMSMGTLYALLSGFFMAIAALTIRKLSASEPAGRTIFYYCLIGSVVSLPFATTHWVSLSADTWELLIAIGVMLFFIQYSLIFAFRYTKASVLAPISYSTIVFSGALDILFWNKIPDMYDFIGVGLVVLSGLSTIFIERVKEKVRVE